MRKLIDAALAISDWSDIKREYLVGLADEIIDEFDLTIDDVNTISDYDCIGNDDDKEIIYFIKMELEERKESCVK
mgnify:CR=1 FL=1